MNSVTSEGEQLPTWDSVVGQYWARVMRLAYRLTGNRDDAEDLTQEVFIRVFKSWHTYQLGTLAGWLHRITTNLFLDQARRKSKIRFDALLNSEDPRLDAAHLTREVAGPERSFEFNNLDADIIQALKDLAPEYRAAIVLSDLEGLSYDAVAQILGIKLGTVRSRIHRGRAQLRDKLAHRAPQRTARKVGFSNLLGAQ